jgi:hypothetical protein
LIKSINREDHMHYTFPSGPKGLPFFGKALDLRHDPLKFFTQTERKYGAIATIPIRNWHLVFELWHNP